MHPVFIYLFSGLLGYLVGAISNAVWVSKTYGVDILKAGSGNPGATNVKRVVGKKAGNLVFALDLLKGFVAAVWPLIPPLHALVPR
jgi:acyl phosphate:glycerol-3-phosphate acyltransferase